MTSVRVDRTDRRSNLEMRHGAIAREPMMTAEQFAELKALLEPISRCATLMMAEYLKPEPAAAPEPKKTSASKSKG